MILDGRTVTMGLVASSKIWVYDPKEPVGTRRHAARERHAVLEKPAPRAKRAARTTPVPRATSEKARAAGR